MKASDERCASARACISVREATPADAAEIARVHIESSPSDFGGARVGEEEIERGSRTLRKVAQGWTDIEALIGRPGAPP